MVKGVLLTPLPFREPDRVVLFRADAPGYVHQAALNREEFFAVRDRSDLFESVAVLNESPASLTAPDQMEAVTGVSASDDFLPSLGVVPLLGRLATRRDVGEEVRQRRHDQPRAVEPPLQSRSRHRRPCDRSQQPADARGRRTAGRFHLYLGPDVINPRVDIWYPRPLSYDTEDFRGRIVIARLRRDVTIETARAAMTTLAARLIAEHPSAYSTRQLRLSLQSLDREVVTEVEPALAALSGAVAFVLLVACANLANLLLARAAARRRELAVRVSIGASRGQIVAQLVTEGMVLGVLGAAGGLLIANWCVDGLLLLAPAGLPRREVIGMDGVAAAFAVAVALASAVAASLVPAWHSARTDAVRGLKERQPDRGVPPGCVEVSLRRSSPCRWCCSSVRD